MKQIQKQEYSSLRSFEDKYIELKDGLKVFLKATNKEEINALKELQNILGVPELIDYFPITHLFIILL